MNCTSQLIVGKTLGRIYVPERIVICMPEGILHTCYNIQEYGLWATRTGVRFDHTTREEEVKLTAAPGDMGDIVDESPRS